MVGLVDGREGRRGRRICCRRLAFHNVHRERRDDAVRQLVQDVKRLNGRDRRHAAGLRLDDEDLLARRPAAPASMASLGAPSKRREASLRIHLSSDAAVRLRKVRVERGVAAKTTINENQARFIHNLDPPAHVQESVSGLRVVGF